jgi:GNAT superfamily N-acetyltransferase
MDSRCLSTTTSMTPTNMSHGYNLITQVKVPPTLYDINRYRDIRLEAIATDPSCFLSTYERELSLSEDEWRARLDSNEKATFTARATSDEDDTDGRWVGTITILGPQTITQSMSEFPEEITPREPMSIYMIVGMWIHPDHRQKGIGKRLVGACFEWVLQRRSGVEKAENVAWVVLQVGANNVTARKLYEAMGFVEVEDENGALLSSEREGMKEFWMKRVLV